MIRYMKRKGKKAMEISARLIKTYKTSTPDAKFIGRCYGDKDKKDDTFSWLWDEWFGKNLFAPLEPLAGDADFIEDGDSYFGLCRVTADGAFQYWIGMVVPQTAVTTDGCESFPIPACEAVVNWVYGKEPDIYFMTA